MKCHKVLYALMITPFIFACSDNSSRSQVFPNSVPDCAQTASPHNFVVEWKDGRVTLERAKSRQDFIDRILDPNIEKIKFAEQGQIVHIDGVAVATATATPSPTPSPTPVPGDPLETWGQQVIGADKLWAKGIKGKGVLIAVIDTGTDLSHPDLINHLYTNLAETPGDGVDNDKNGYVDDVQGWDYVTKTNKVIDENGHGTHVTGIIAGDHAGGVVKGVAPESKVLPLRFLDANGSGDLADAVLAIEYAVQQGAKVINGSWGGRQCFQSLGRAIDRLSEKGVIFVAAAGNDGADLNSSPRYPAAYNFANLLTIGASTPRGFTAGYSNTGTHVHFVAPGSDILSTYYTAKYGHTYAYRDGTSMSAPFTSGSAALLISAKPTASAQDVKNALIGGVSKGFCCNLTEGELNVFEAHKKLTGTP